MSELGLITGEWKSQESIIVLLGSGFCRYAHCSSQRLPQILCLREIYFFIFLEKFLRCSHFKFSASPDPLHVFFLNLFCIFCRYSHFSSQRLPQILYLREIFFFVSFFREIFALFPFQLSAPFPDPLHVFIFYFFVYFVAISIAVVSTSPRSFTCFSFFIFIFMYIFAHFPGFRV